jgi:hypothetical protein
MRWWWIRSKRCGRRRDAGKEENTHTAHDHTRGDAAARMRWWWIESKRLQADDTTQDGLTYNSKIINIYYII